MSDEFDIYELKQMIEDQKERIDALIRLQSLQGLSLAEIEYFTLSFSGDRIAKFLSKIQSCLKCSPISLEKIAKELPQYIELRWETYQKGIGYNSFSSLLNETEEQLVDGYEFVRETVKRSYIDGRVSEQAKDDRNYDDYIFNISLNECLSKEEIAKISNGEEECVQLRAYFNNGKFIIVIDGKRDIFQVYSVGYFDAVEMKKYAHLEPQVFTNYFERTYCIHEEEFGFFLRRHIKNFLAKRTENISQIKPGMNWLEAKELLGDPVLKYPNRGDFSIEFYWVNIPWPNESNDDYMIPLITKKKPKEKVNEFDLDFEFVVAGYGWDYLDTILK